MKIAKAAEVYSAINKTATEDSKFRDELSALFEGVKDEEISGPKSQRIADFLAADSRIPFEKTQDADAAWITIPITISIALCPSPAY